MDGLLGIFEQQFKKGEPYREAVRGLLRGDTSGFNKLNAPTPANPQEAVDIATGFAGTIKPVQREVFESAFNLAQQRAALPISEGGLGLPANNTAMDRAKAMGFDTSNIAYHGTGADIKEFNTKNVGQLGEGAYFTNQPGYASKFAAGSMYKRGSSEATPNVIPTYLKFDNPYYFDNINKEPTKSFLKKNKYDSIIYNAGTGADNLNYNEFVALNPSQIRSVNAAFDPFRRNEADILAGVAAAPVGLLAVDKEKKRKTSKITSHI